jgi:branched-chain amino acid transport system substrate-binding protein
MSDKPMWMTILTLLITLTCSLGHTAEKLPASRVRIAFIGAYTGADPNTSKELDRGLNVFLETHPRAKTLFDIKRVDNKGSVLESLKLIQANAAEGIQINVGIARSDEAIAAAKSAAELKVNLITPFATSTELSRMGRFVHQVCFNDAAQGRALAKFVQGDLKPKKILILKNSESVYSSGLTEEFKKGLLQLGSTAQLHEDRYNNEDLKIETVLGSVQSFEPDLVFIPDHITRASLLAKKINKLKPSIRFLGGDGFGGKKVLTGIFNDAPSLELYFTTHWERGIKNATNTKFLDGYKALYKSDEPTTGAALTYDAFNILYDIYSGAPKTMTPEKLAQLLKTRNYTVTTGTFRAAAENEVSGKSVVVMQLKEGNYRVFKTLEP